MLNDEAEVKIQQGCGRKREEPRQRNPDIDERQLGCRIKQQILMRNTSQRHRQISHECKITKPGIARSRAGSVYRIQHIANTLCTTTIGVATVRSGLGNLRHSETNEKIYSRYQYRRIGVCERALADRASSQTKKALFKPDSKPTLMPICLKIQLV